MTTECFAMVRGSSLRITSLLKCGSVPDPVQYGVSKSVTRITINEITEPGNSELLRNLEDEPRLHLRQSDQMVRFKTDIDFIRCDPGILNLVTGVPLVENAFGDVVGFDSNTRLPAKAFALEVWSQLASSGCSVSDLGFGEGSFGEMPFGGNDDGGTTAKQYGYTLAPYLKGGFLSGFQFANGLVSFSLRGAQTRRNSKWGAGPYYLTETECPEPLGVSGNLMLRTFITPVPPPTQTDGIQGFSDSIDGGDAMSTSTDVIDGEFVVTSPCVVEGGSAA